MADILASEHEEAIHSAVNTLKSLIHNCIDESLIKEGVDEIKQTNLNMDSRKSGPTIIEKVCAMIESLLGYHYTAVLDLSFQVISSMFDKLGIVLLYLLLLFSTSLTTMYYILSFLILLNLLYILFHAGADSSYLMSGILKSMADLQKLPDEDFPFRKQV